MQPSSNNRKDFEIKIDVDDLIVYKSPLLMTVNISRKNLKQILNNILEDHNANIRDLKTPDRQTKRRIKKVKKLINAVASKEEQYLKNKLNIDAEGWSKKLIDHQLIAEGNYYKFGEEFEEFETICNTPRIEKIEKTHMIM